MMRKEPPIVFNRSELSDDNRILAYDYNGRELVRIEIPGGEDVRYRVKSDACIQSNPRINQIYLIVDSEPQYAKCTFTLSPDAVVMKPHRARPEQAVMGQVGRPTVRGANGLYDRLDDLLVSWTGYHWRWLDGSLEPDENGNLQVSIEIEVGREPFVINTFPQYYRKHLGYEHHKPWERRPKLDPVAGWCSWEAYLRDVSEDKVRDAADFIAKNFRDYGMDFVQIDDGYQQTPIVIRKDRPIADAWFTPSDHFPNGLKAICDEIKGKGLKPGIWISASIWPPDEGDDVEEDLDCLLKDENGELLDSRWIHRALDCEPATLEKHIIPLFNRLRDAGFEYIKTDQIRHLLYDALEELVHRGVLTNDEAHAKFRRYMECTRAAMGDKITYLASWGVLTEVVGLCDACRIACDANPHWQRIRMQIVEAARWFHTQRVLFLNDPDHICARTKPAWAQALLSHVSLTGGLFMISDPINAYDEQRVRMIQKTLPTLATVTAETGPMDMHYNAFAWTKEHGAAYKGKVELVWDDPTDDEGRKLAGYQETMNDDHPLSSLWSMHLNTGAGAWCVAGRFATVALRASTLSMTNLGLDPEKEYEAFDFWAEKYLGTVKGTMEVPVVELGCCQIISLREKMDRPQLLSSTRHVSMDAVSVLSQEWADGILTIGLNGIDQTSESYWVHCPEGCTFASAEAEGATVGSVVQEDGTVMLPLSFNSETAVLKVSFR